MAMSIINIITTKRIFNIPLLHSTFSLLSSSFSTTTTTTTTPTSSSPSKTPLEKQFESWINHLKPGFIPADVNNALASQSDPDLALDIFRWTSQQRSYKHTSLTYLTIINHLITSRHYQQAETLVEEVIAGACDPTLPLYNTIIRFCCSRKFLFNRAFDVYNKMLNSQDCKPNLETYTLLFNSLLLSLALERRFEDAIEVMFDMLSNSRSPDHLTYKTVLEGLCREGRVDDAFELLDECKKRDFYMNEKMYKTLFNDLQFVCTD